VPYQPEGWLRALLLPAALVLAFFPAIPVTIVAVVLPTALASLLDWIVIEPVARLLESESIATLIRIGSAVLLVVGFHFSLLAS
jgi:hypothetical protein